MGPRPLNLKTSRHAWPNWSAPQKHRQGDGDEESRHALGTTRSRTHAAPRQTCPDDSPHKPRPAGPDHQRARDRADRPPATAVAAQRWTRKMTKTLSRRLERLEEQMMPT